MELEIGTIVRRISDRNKLNRYIILATKKQKLDNEFLASKSGEFHINNFEKIAENKLEVTGGFDYLICLQDEYFTNGKSNLTGNFILVTEEEIFI